MHFGLVCPFLMFYMCCLKQVTFMQLQMLMHNTASSQRSLLAFLVTFSSHLLVCTLISDLRAIYFLRLQFHLDVAVYLHSHCALSEWSSWDYSRLCNPGKHSFVTDRSARSDWDLQELPMAAGAAILNVRATHAAFPRLDSQQFCGNLSCALATKIMAW